MKSQAVGRGARRGELQYQLDASGIPIGLLEAVAVEGSNNRRRLVDAPPVAVSNNPAGPMTRQIRPEYARLVADSQAEAAATQEFVGFFRAGVHQWLA